MQENDRAPGLEDNRPEAFPTPEQLARGPVNYANEGKYSEAHVTLHERLGPWAGIQSEAAKRDSSVEVISDVNPDLKLENPRAVNSWAESDETDFDWKA